MKFRLLATSLVAARLALAQVPPTQSSMPVGQGPAPSGPVIGHTPTAAGRLVPELRYNFSPDGKLYFKATFLNQIWVRYNQSNAGTTVLSQAKSNTLDIGLRRTRIQFYGQIHPLVFVYFQFGQNNFNFLANQNTTNSGNRKNQAFFHDAVVELTPFGNYLKLGAGLNIVSGLSRFRQPSIGTIMTMDVPVFAQATVDQIDEFSRMLGVYARGQAGPLDYRVGIADPFPITSNGNTPPAAIAPTKTAQFASRLHYKQYQGYLAYNFFEQESHVTPGYMTGTYLGKKKIFNIGGGFITQQSASWTSGGQAGNSPSPDSANYHNLNLWCIETFLDIPLNAEQQTALSAYAGYFNTDYGTNYLRYNGIMNPAIGSQAAAGTNSYIGANTGNAYPMFGTGQVVYAQAGYLLAGAALGQFGTLMPYATAQLADYKALADKVGTYGAGINWLIDGHRAKITLDWQNRADFRLGTPPTDKPTQAGRRNQVVLQYQVFI